jgi:penicillin-binding protein 1A
MERSGKVVLWAVLSFLLLATVAVGIVTGVAIASVENIFDIEQHHNQQSALPSQVLDRHGRLITEFFSDENRELVSIDELPSHLIYALITREDQTFFDHRGFSFRGTARAAWNLLTNRYVSGGSTLTQQLAGHLFADRSEFSVYRKIRELWWALQLERHWTKYEILEAYLNRMWFGHGNYGVEAASQFFFGHSARELSVAESVMLVIQLANPSLYSPIRRPNEARNMQRIILQRMVELGYTTQEEVDLSMELYWSTYDFSRANTSTAFFEREDRAPYFSEYVRFQLENRILLGSLNINTDGYVIHTTLDLDFQQEADRLMRSGIARANSVYRQNISNRSNYGDDLVPLIDLLALTFNLPELRVGDIKARERARQHYQENLVPVVDILSLMFMDDNQEGLRHAVRTSHARTEAASRRTTVEGALIALENNTGHIVAMVGGRDFESRNQFNRATSALIEPGSAYKPLYYAAAINDRVITPATMIYDAPVVFRTAEGEAYTPLNFRGEWSGPVLVRESLSHSMNIPSLKILDMVGFTSALNTSADLLGIRRQDMEQRGLIRLYPVGLGVFQTSPVEMASAYATFANQGRRMEPLAVRYVEDRTGRVIEEPEADLRRRERQSGGPPQVISPQAAYVMTDMLRSTVTHGTLRYAASVAGGFDLPMAGKTGTTQNWSSAWTVGYSPYYTTAVWLGFDRGGNNSLGVNQTGAVTAGPIWSQFMKAIHRDVEPREFIRPDGLVEATVAARTGLLPPGEFTGRTVRELFIAGTQPTRFDTQERFEREQAPVLMSRLREGLDSAAFSLDTSFSTPISSDLDLSLSLSLSDPDQRRFDDDEDQFELIDSDPFSGFNPLLD